MTLSIEEVEYIADLARLQLSKEEINLYREQLSDILDYAARLVGRSRRIWITC